MFRLCSITRHFIAVYPSSRRVFGLFDLTATRYSCAFPNDIDQSAQLTDLMEILSGTEDPNNPNTLILALRNLRKPILNGLSASPADMRSGVLRNYERRSK
jgi:hypothetical protein